MRMFQIQVTFKLRKTLENPNYLFSQISNLCFKQHFLVLKFRNISLSKTRFEPGNILRLNIKNVGMYLAFKPGNILGSA